MELTNGTETITFPVKKWKKFSNPTLEFMLKQGFSEVVPEPPPPLTEDEIAAQYEAEITAKIQAMEDGLDMMIEGVAEAKGYGKFGMTSTASCLSYAGYDNSHRTKAEAFGQWGDNLWIDALQIQADFLYGLIEEPTFEEVVAQLAPMVWPS